MKLAVRYGTHPQGIGALSTKHTKEDLSRCHHSGVACWSFKGDERPKAHSLFGPFVSGCNFKPYYNNSPSVFFKRLQLSNFSPTHLGVVLTFCGRFAVGWLAGLLRFVMQLESYRVSA